MKVKQILISVWLVLQVCPAPSQGTLTFVYDQQSAIETDATEDAIPNLLASQPAGQSFTPALASVGFVRLDTYDSSLGHNQSAVMEVVLRSISITGSILGTSVSVTLPASFAGYPNFIFSTPVSVTPGTTYYFQPILLSGNEGLEMAFPQQYSGGTAFTQGVPTDPSRDMWFREGLVVPEPSIRALLVLGGGMLALAGKRRHES